MKDMWLPNELQRSIYIPIIDRTYDKGCNKIVADKF